MNRERILTVAKAIESAEIPNLGFNMGSYFQNEGSYKSQFEHDCKTTACIAGWTVAVERLDESMLDVQSAFKPFNGGKKNISDEAQEYLDLKWEDADALFTEYPDTCDGLSDVSPEMAVNVLYYAYYTGTIDWNASQVVMPLLRKTLAERDALKERVAFLEDNAAG